MKNKAVINKLKDNSELAWASYGYFHLADKSYNHNDKYEKRLKEFRELKAKALGKEIDESIYPTYADILNITYKYYLDDNGKPKDGFFDDGFLGGDFSPLQAKQFFSRYDLLKHCPNTNSGFSATLFYDKQKDEFVVGFRGTEGFWNMDTMQDITLSLNGNLQSSPLLEFLEQVDKIIKNENKSIIFIEHSLGEIWGMQ